VSEKACHAERCIAERSISFGWSALKGRTFAQAQEDSHRIVPLSYVTKHQYPCQTLGNSHSVLKGSSCGLGAVPTGE
jgi:hypothetical protein